MGSYNIIKNSGVNPILLIKCLAIFSFVLLLINQIVAMEKIYPPIDSPKPSSTMSKLVPESIRFYFTGEIEQILQKILNDELSVQDPNVQSKLSRMPLMCTAEALQFLLNKGMVFKANIAHRLAIGERTRDHFLPDRLKNLKILMNAGYKLNITNEWQKKVILYLCLYQSKDDHPAERRATREPSIYAVISDIVSRGTVNPNAKNVTGNTVLSDVIKRLYPTVFERDENQFYIRPDRKLPIIKVLWVCGANQISEKRKKRLEERMPQVLEHLNSLDLNKAAIFQAVKDRDSEALKRLALCMPFLIKNGDGDNPLHFAVRKAVDGPGEERDKSLEIIGLILRILPQLLLETTTSEPKCTPIVMIIGFKRSLLPPLHKLCEGKKSNEPKPTQAS